jgi:hypothetical protein
MGILNLNFIATFLGSCNELSVLAEFYCIRYVHFIPLALCVILVLICTLQKKASETLQYNWHTE